MKATHKGYKMGDSKDSKKETSKKKEAPAKKMGSEGERKAAPGKSSLKGKAYY